MGHNYRTTALGRILDLEAPELAIIFTRTRMEVDDLTESLAPAASASRPFTAVLTSRPATAS